MLPTSVSLDSEVSTQGSCCKHAPPPRPGGATHSSRCASGKSSSCTRWLKWIGASPGCLPLLRQGFGGGPHQVGCPPPPPRAERGCNSHHLGCNSLRDAELQLVCACRLLRWLLLCTVRPPKHAPAGATLQSMPGACWVGYTAAAIAGDWRSHSRRRPLLHTATPVSSSTPCSLQHCQGGPWHGQGGAQPGHRQDRPQAGHGACGPPQQHRKEAGW